jgi:hypothetical protein
MNTQQNQCCTSAEIADLVAEGLGTKRLLPAQVDWALALGRQNPASLRCYLDNAQPVGISETTRRNVNLIQATEGGERGKSESACQFESLERIDYHSEVERILSVGAPRSEPYKQGLARILELRNRKALGMPPLPPLTKTMPYPEGTPEADAFFSGCDRGHVEWNQRFVDRGEGGIE